VAAAMTVKAILMICFYIGSLAIHCSHCGTGCRRFYLDHCRIGRRSHPLDWALDSMLGLPFLDLLLTLGLVLLEGDCHFVMGLALACGSGSEATIANGLNVESYT
jgi:hypothetical protein